MIISTQQLAIDGVAVKMVGVTDAPKVVYIHCVVGGSLYINGSSSVTTSTGFLIDKAVGVFTVEIGADDEIWGITAAGTHTFTVMQVSL